MPDKTSCNNKTKQTKQRKREEEDAATCLRVCLNSAEDEQTGWEKDRKPLVTGDGNFSDKLGTKQYNQTK